MIHLRPATIFDVEALIRVHHASVHGPAPSTFYTQKILQSWSPSPTDTLRINQLRKAIENSTELVVVAESTENAVIIGFGSVVPAQQELRAVYVDPLFGRQGAGPKILSHLEALAILHSTDILHVDASLNAERFYNRHGYSVVQRASHRLSSGVDMDCVKMSKKLCTQ